MFAKPWVTLWAIALAASILNAIKPMHMDDALYCEIADQIVRDPTDPFGAEVVWHQHPRPMLESGFHPLYPYLIAGMQAVVGGNDILIRMVCLPFIAMLLFSLHSLARRVAVGWEMPTTLLAAFSPAFFPGWNLMLDLPAHACLVAAVSVLWRTTERGGWLGAGLAGALLGLAILFKYNSVAGLGIFAALGLVCWRPSLAILAVFAALFVFGIGEYFCYLQYGDTPFLFARQHAYPNWFGWYRLMLYLIPASGSVLMFPALLGVVRLGMPLGMGGLLGLLAVGSFDPQFRTLAGFTVWGMFLSGCAYLTKTRWRHAERYITWVLILWVLNEIAAYFISSPFPAIRRLIGISTASTLLMGHWMSTGSVPVSRTTSREYWATWAITACGLAYSLLVFGVDFREAWCCRQAALDAVRAVKNEHGMNQAWFTPHWGFQQYARKAGLRIVHADETVLAAGDGVVMVPALESVLVRERDLEVVQKIAYEDSIPFCTVPGYYARRFALELREVDAITGSYVPRLECIIYRATKSSRLDTRHSLLEYVRVRQSQRGIGRMSGPLAIQLRDPVFRMEERRQIAVVLGDLGAEGAGAVEGLKASLGEEDVELRRSVVEALGKIGASAKSAEPELRRLAAADPSIDVRQAAAVAVKRLTDP
jgi:hypothetical protein